MSEPQQKTMKIKTTGKSLKELKEIYGTGSSGFYPQSWYENESFYTEKPEAGTYEIEFDRKLCNKTYKEQLKELPKGFSPTHPAIIVEAILSYFKETGERLLENWYVKSDTLGSGGGRVLVGGFDGGGLGVGGWRDVSRDDVVGLSASRKLETGNLESLDTSESLKLESAIKIVKDAGYQISKII